MDIPDFYRGLIIVEPYGTYIRNRKKTMIVKSRLFNPIIDNDLLLIENKMAFGIIQLGYPKIISLNEFTRLGKKHLITETDRINWWPGYKELYAYPVTKTKFFKIPLLINYSTGPQITVKPENIIVKQIFVGMSGYYYSQMYPKNVKNILQYYSEHLNSVEINSTFYKFPTENTVKNLKRHDLSYTIKVNQYITHSKKLNDVKKYWNDFYDVFVPIHDKIICFLFQFSASFQFNNKNLSGLKILANYLNKKHRYAFEFRHIGWFNNDKVNKLFQRYGLVLVICNVNNDKGWADSLLDGYNPPLNQYQQTSDTIYIRMHGTTGKYTGAYHNNDLNELFKFISQKPITNALVYFNNTDIDADAFNDAIRLSKKFNYLNR